MGINADATGIQFRMLNQSKGPSVRSPRIQCDKKAYQFRMKAVLEKTMGLAIQQANVSGILVDGKRSVTGVETELGMAIYGSAVVLTAGTFLRGLLHVGETSRPGGRMADASSGLSDSVRQLGFEVARFKTGTPCRIAGRSINFQRCDIQRGDEPAPRFSFLPPEAAPSSEIFTLNSGPFQVEQMPCWITRTTVETHDIIRRNLHRSPLYSGRIEGTGPRYCPSIEDKIVKFGNRESHQIFLEPEGKHTDEYYVNGLSTSLPYDVQVAFIRSVPGLEGAELMRLGYAVEYDYFPPTQLRPTLETKLFDGLYFAGQVNGTSGYEEAAAQGLIAGTNAALKIQNRPTFVLSRDEAYIGVLIDDLTSTGTDEPYRMFTSRAENRLSLRQDNADQRLTEKGFEVGLVDSSRHEIFRNKMAQLRELLKSVHELRIDGKSLSALLRMTDFKKESLPPEIQRLAPHEIWELVEIDLKYEGYVQRQAGQDQKLIRRRRKLIPGDIDYERIPGLRRESRQKLTAGRPTSIGQAEQLRGMTPADISILSIWLEKNSLDVSRERTAG